MTPLRTDRLMSEACRLSRRRDRLDREYRVLRAAEGDLLGRIAVARGAFQAAACETPRA